MIKARLYLACPPPSSTVHLGKNSGSFVWASIVFFGGINQTLCKFWITVEDSDTLEDIAAIKFKLMSFKVNFLSKELWKSVWEFLVNNLVKFICT